MNRIQSKYHRIRACEIKTISLPYFDDKIYILNDGYNGLVKDYSYSGGLLLVTRANYKKQLS